jgi:hypothetical protein
MNESRAHEATLRLDRPELTRLAWAFGVSLALHLFAWGTYAVGEKFQLWERLPWPAWVQRAAQSLSHVVARPETPPPPSYELPLVFIEVSDLQAISTPPEKATHYSDKSAVAANPEADKETHLPKITGTQTLVAKTEDVPRDVSREKFDQLLPAPTPAPVEPPKPVEPDPAPAAGELTVGQPDRSPRSTPAPPERTRPRTLREAMLRQNLDMMPGQKMKQDGGTRRQSLAASFDTKVTAFGAYDRMFIETVQQRWYDLLDSMSYDGYRQGRVSVQFLLNYDGRITEMRVVENTVTDMLGLLCQKAVLDPAPFDKWPREMRLLVGRDHRRINFTFYYN